jgi:hypothetical protein
MSSGRIGHQRRGDKKMKKLIIMLIILIMQSVPAAANIVTDIAWESGILGLCDYYRAEFEEGLGAQAQYDLDPVSIITRGESIPAYTADVNTITEIITKMEEENYTRADIITAIQAIRGADQPHALRTAVTARIGYGLLVFLVMVQILSYLFGGEAASGGRMIWLIILGVVTTTQIGWLEGLILGPLEELAAQMGTLFSHNRQLIAQSDIWIAAKQSQNLAREMQQGIGSAATALSGAAISWGAGMMADLVSWAIAAIAGALAWAMLCCRQVLLAITIALGPIFSPMVVSDFLRPWFLGWLRTLALLGLWKLILVAGFVAAQELQMQHQTAVLAGAQITAWDTLGALGYGLLQIALVISSPYFAASITRGAGMNAMGGVQQIASSIARLAR